MIEVDDLIKQKDLIIKQFQEEVLQLKEIVYKDKLTGCYNRNWWMEKITNDFEGYIIFADVNCLRTINFVLGHVEGDRLIVNCCNLFKKYGKVARIGGDEFVIVCDNENKYNELITMKDNRFSLGGCFKPKQMKVAKAISIADKQLFENKRYNKGYGDYEI